MSKVVIEKLSDGTEHEFTIEDDKLAENLVKTRDRFSFKGGSAKTKPKGLPIREVIPDEERSGIPDGKPIAPKVSLEDLNKLNRPQLVALAKKVNVSAAGKNSVIAKRIFDKTAKAA